jgi:hypothetical protein
MSKLYVFGIGGTGARVIKSLTLLLAAGVDCKYDIETILIDSDVSNGNLTDTVNLLQEYECIQSNVKNTSATSNEFFKTPIAYQRWNIPNSDEKFKDFIGLANQSAETKALSQLLFDKDNELEQNTTIGYRGRPNMGCVAMNQLLNLDSFLQFTNGFSDGDRIFIIGSIFGGTGASGFPWLYKTLRNGKLANNESLIHKSKIGAISVLPYFKVKSDKASPIDSATFISKAKSALVHYDTAFKDIDCLYYISANPADFPTYENHDGGDNQKNPANIIELLAATSILDFANKSFNAKSQGTSYFELGIEDIKSKNVSFKELPKNVREMIQKPLIRFSLFANYMDFHYADAFDKLPVYTDYNIKDIRGYLCGCHKKRS